MQPASPSSPQAVVRSPRSAVPWSRPGRSSLGAGSRVNTGSLHSPLLGPSQLLSLPPPTDMLKLGGSSQAPSGRFAARCCAGVPSSCAGLCGWAASRLLSVVVWSHLALVWAGGGPARLPLATVLLALVVRVVQPAAAARCRWWCCRRVVAALIGSVYCLLGAGSLGVGSAKQTEAL
jgi:hypothetical protein